MKNFLLILCVIFAGKTFAQVGVNTTNASSTLSVNGSVQAKYNQVTASYTLTINDHYLSYSGTADATITLPTVGAGVTSFAGRIYRIKNISSNTLSLVPSNGNLLRVDNLAGTPSFLIPPGHYVEVVNNINTSSATWDISFLGDTEVVQQEDATRFLGGTVYARFNQSSNGTLSSGSVISSNYAVGTNNTSVTPRAGGINSIIGSGYKVSNPSNGIYDIQFNTAYTQIYGISVNIVDAYGVGSGVPAGKNPEPEKAGASIATNDNAQVAYISNGIIRIKTGDSNGVLSNRSFTFLVTGR